MEWLWQMGEALQAREEGEGQVVHYRNIFKSRKDNIRDNLRQEKIN